MRVLTFAFPTYEETFSGFMICNEENLSEDAIMYEIEEFVVAIADRIGEDLDIDTLLNEKENIMKLLKAKIPSDEDPEDEDEDESETSLEVIFSGESRLTIEVHQYELEKMLVFM